MNARVKIFLLVVGWTLGSSPAAIALDFSLEQCFRASPTVQKGENLYAYPKIRKLTETEFGLANELLLTLAGRWQGQMDEINCHGSEDDASAEMIHNRAEALALFGRELDWTIRVDLFCEEKRVRSQQIYSISLKEKILRWGGDYGWAEPISISAGRLSLLFKTGAYGMLREFFITIEGDSNILVIDEEVYAAGKLCCRRNMRLAR